MPKTSKRIINFMFVIFFTICIAGCEKTNGNGVQVNATPDVAATPLPTASQTSVPETSTQSTNSTVATTMSHENAVFIPQTPEETLIEENPTEEFSTEETTLEETTTEEAPTQEDPMEEMDNPDEKVSSTNCWGIVTSSVDVVTSTGKYPVERGNYILILSEYETSYTIAWYGSTAVIPSDCVQVLENVTPELEEKILLSHTVGVIEP